MSLQLITPPALEPVTLEEAKAHLKLDTDADDALVTALIAAARARAEWHTARAFLAQAWVLWRDCIPPDGLIEIPLPPLQAVASVKTYAPDDTETVLDASAYRVDASASPARLLIEDASAFANLRALNAVRIEFTAGYGDAADDVPAPLREAILLIVADLYANRGDAPSEAPSAALALMAPYRVMNL